MELRSKKNKQLKKKIIKDEVFSNEEQLKEEKKHNKLKFLILRLEQMVIFFVLFYYCLFKVHRKKIGSVFATCDRTLWQNSLMYKHDTSLYCVDNQISLKTPIFTKSEILFTSEQLQNNELTKLQKYAILAILFDLD